MRIILRDYGNLILQARAAESVLKRGREGSLRLGGRDVSFVDYEDGSSFSVVWNKDSLSVYPQRETA